jgi:hypothetical protein
MADDQQPPKRRSAQEALDKVRERIANARAQLQPMTKDHSVGPTAAPKIARRLDDALSVFDDLCSVVSTEVLPKLRRQNGDGN